MPPHMKVLRPVPYGRSRLWFDKRYVTLIRLDHVYGDYRPSAEAGESEVPFRITYGYSKDKRPT